MRGRSRSLKQSGQWKPNGVPDEQATMLPGFEHADVPATIARTARSGSADVAYRPVQQILTAATGFIEEYDYTLNPYSGCAFGCTYCYAAFFARDTQQRDTWGKWVRVKENAVQVLQRPRQRAKLDGARIYMSSVTDPYQPVERDLELTRGLLEIMADGHTPKLVVQTRSPLVARDVDLFEKIRNNGGRVQANMTVTTDDEPVRKTFEPSCPSNARRIEAIREVHDAGVQSCITLTPLLWCEDVDAFVESLLATGITRFIVQPFRFGAGKFVAQTREGALDLMATKLDCARHPKIVEREYMKRYREARAELRRRLREAEAWLGEEREGFAPPF